MTSNSAFTQIELLDQVANVVRDIASAKRAGNGAEPGGGARGPHRDAPSRNAGGGKEAED